MSEEMMILDLLVEQELALAELYTAFGKRFADDGEFWKGISDDEKKHSTWVQRLKAQAAQGAVEFDAGRTREQAVRISIGYIKTMTDRAIEEDMLLFDALTLSHDIENSLIEKQVFRHFTSDSEEMKRVLTRLEEVTREHRDKLKTVLDKYRV
jgi:rubrerythrin